MTFRTFVLILFSEENRIGDAGCLSLVDGLKANKTMKRINFEGLICLASETIIV